MEKPFHRQAIIILLLSLIVLSCNKNRPPEMPEIKDDYAKIIMAGFACGPACDAIGYVVQASDGTLFSPKILPAPFRVNSLPVKITYKRTGNFPAPYAGPYYEQINIVQITQ